MSYYSDIMLPMPRIVGWTRDIQFLIGWLEAYVEATELGVDSLDGLR